MAQGIRKTPWHSYFVDLKHILPTRRMKPTRIRMCHSLVMNYGLYKKMEIFVSLFNHSLWFSAVDLMPG
jgi:histone deacetylase 1/2